MVVLGTAGVVYSRDQRGPAASRSAESTDNTAPRVGDHWHAAYAVDLCGKVLDPITDQSDLGHFTKWDESGPETVGTFSAVA